MLGMDSPRSLDPFAPPSSKVEDFGKHSIMQEVKQNMEEIIRLERKNATLRKRLNASVIVSR